MKDTTKLFMLAALFTASSSFAGGFDNSYFPDDIYFGKNRVSGSLAWTDVKAVGDLTSNDVTKTTNDVYIMKYSPVAAGRYMINDKFGISAQYQKPYRANTRYNTGFFPGTPTHSELETELVSVGLTYSHSLNEDANIQLIAGVNRLDGYGGFGTDLDTATTTIDITDLKFKEGYFGMLGVGYEIPDYALRISAMYYPKFQTTANGKAVLMMSGSEYQSVDASVSKMAVSPERLHIHVQSGITPTWLGLAGYIHAKWSSVPKLTVAFSSPLASMPGAEATLFDKDAQYYYIGAGHLLSKKVKLSSVLFYEPARENPVTGLRTPSRGGVFSTMLGINYDATKNLSVGFQASYINAKATDITYTTASSSVITGKFPTSHGAKYTLTAEYRPS